MADRQPRPGLAVLLAGRFRVSRPALLARPGGPVAGVDVASGAGVRVQLAPPELDHAELGGRITRANALRRPGCPLVEVADDPPARWLAVRPPDGAVALADGPASARLAARASALGAALDAAGLGLADPARALGVAGGEPCLLEPAVGAADLASPLAAAFADAVAARVGEGAPRPWEPSATTADRRPTGVGRRLLPVRLGGVAGAAARPRLAVALAAAAAVVGGYAATAHIGGAAGAGRTTTPTARAAAAAPAGSANASASGTVSAAPSSNGSHPAGTAVRPRRSQPTPSHPARPRAGRAPAPGTAPVRARGGLAVALPWPAPSPRTTPEAAAPIPPRRARWRPRTPPLSSVCQSAGFCT